MIRKEWNPNTGTWYEESFDSSEDKIVVHTKQDVQPVLDLAKEQRNSGVNDKVGEFSRYAIIPAHVEIALKQRGIDIYNKNNTRKLIQTIEREYPYLKTTNLKHDIKGDGSV